MTPSPWISVEERLPDEWETVFVGWIGTPYVEKGYYAEGKWSEDDGSDMKTPPTHWQPLPAPPGGEE